MAAVKGINWNVVRKDYEELGLNPAALSIKYNVAATTVYQKARSEGWRRPIEEEEPIIDEEFVEEIEYANSLVDVENAIKEQKIQLGMMMRELAASTTKPGQIKQWIKEGTAGSIDSRRKIMYQ